MPLPFYCIIGDCRKACVNYATITCNYATFSPINDCNLAVENYSTDPLIEISPEIEILTVTISI